MDIYEIEREKFLESILPLINPAPNEEYYLKSFCENPYCHFYLAKKDEQNFGLLIAELKYGKLEIFRYFNFSLEQESFLSFINFFVQNPQISGIAVFQNLKDYFPVLEKIGFKYDADIMMMLDIAHYKKMTVPVLEFENLNEKHSRFISELRKDCYKNDFYQKLVHRECLDIYCTESVKQIFKEKSFGFVGKVKSKYVGVVIWIENDKPGIIDIMVHPEMQGRGYGKALLHKAIINLKEKGFSSISLGVFESNHPAHELYRNAGFVETEKLKMMSWQRSEQCAVKSVNLV